MIWNCDGEFICDAPNNAMNWAVGNVGVHQGYAAYPEPAGIHQSIGTHVTPRSLYFAQLKGRLNLDAVRNIVTGPQEMGNIWLDILAWAGEGRLSESLSIYGEFNGEILLSDLTDNVIDIWGSVEDLVFLADGPITYSWSQTSGPLATIGDATSARTTATIPGVGSYTFTLVAINSVAATLSNTVTFNVVTTLAPTNAPTAPPTIGIIESFDYYPEHEAFVRSSSPDKNYDVNGNLALAIGDCCGGERIPYLRWDNLNVNFDGLTEATLRLRVEGFSGTSISFNIFPCETFDEATLTYNTQPACDTQNTILHVDTANAWPQTIVDGLVYHEFNLLPYLQTAKPTELSIVLKPDPESNGQVTYSSEYETLPEWPLLRLNGVAVTTTTAAPPVTTTIATTTAASPVTTTATTTTAAPPVTTTMATTTAPPPVTTTATTTTAAPPVTTTMATTTAPPPVTTTTEAPILYCSNDGSVQCVSDSDCTSYFCNGGFNNGQPCDNSSGDADCVADVFTVGYCSNDGSVQCLDSASCQYPGTCTSGVDAGQTCYGSGDCRDGSGTCHKNNGEDLLTPCDPNNDTCGGGRYCKAGEEGACTGYSAGTCILPESGTCDISQGVCGQVTSTTTTTAATPLTTTTTITTVADPICTIICGNGDECCTVGYACESSGKPNRRRCVPA